MRSAAVGHQCVDCVAHAAATVPQARNAAGVVDRGGLPVITYALIAANVIVFALTMRPGELSEALALDPIAVADGQYYRLITSAFLHYGIVHILFNMWALYVLGPQLEEYFGRLRFAGLYLLSALGGSVSVFLFSALNTATAGASGAIFGLFGATLVVARQLRLDVGWLVGLIAVNLVITFTVPGISWQGHLGGLATGTAVAAAYQYSARLGRTWMQAAFAVGLLGVFATLVSWRAHEIASTVQIVGAAGGQ